MESIKLNKQMVIKYSTGKDIFNTQSFSNVDLNATDEDMLPVADINGVMNKIIERNIFLSNGGKLVEKVEAKIVARSADSIKVS